MPQFAAHKTGGAKRRLGSKAAEMIGTMRRPMSAVAPKARSVPAFMSTRQVPISGLVARGQGRIIGAFAGDVFGYLKPSFLDGLDRCGRLFRFSEMPAAIGFWTGLDELDGLRLLLSLLNTRGDHR
jgi:hypothetical protein